MEAIKKDKAYARNAGILEWYDALVFALVFLVVVFTFGVRIVAVDGISMNPTLQDGDRLMMQSIGYTPKRGDIVVIDGYNSLGRPLVKRVIGLSGDTLDIDFSTGTVTRNGEVLQEDYIAEPTYLRGDVTFPVTVPPGYIFVMGDNRQYSNDSRFTEVGFIDQRDILGRVLFRIFPLQQIGRIK